MGIDNSSVLERPDDSRLDINFSKKLSSETDNYKNIINGIIQGTNSGNEKNNLKNNSLITLDISGVNLEIFLDSMFSYQKETGKIVNITLLKDNKELGVLSINSDSKKELVLRDITRLKIGSIKSFPKNSKEKLSVYDLEKDRESYFNYINSVVNNKYNNAFIKQNIALTNSKLFYKEIYEDDECAEFCLTMIHFLESIMRNKHHNNQKANANIIFDEVLNAVSKNSGLHLNGEIIKKSFSLIKRFWLYSNHFREKLTFN